jgi:hypothetical protein
MLFLTSLYATIWFGTSSNYFGTYPNSLLVPFFFDFTPRPFQLIYLPLRLDTPCVVNKGLAMRNGRVALAGVPRKKVKYTTKKVNWYTH